MSLFPSEHLSVAITPTAVAVVAYRGRWRPVQYDAHETRFNEGGIDNALAGLAHALDVLAPRGATVHFSISNAFVRAALLPWSGGTLSVEEEATLAHQRFVELYGDMDGWQIQLNCERQYGQSCLAFAMPEPLVAEVLALSRQHELTCRGLRPNAVHSWNRHGNYSQASNLLFSVIDSGYGLLLATQGVGKLRTPVSVRTMALPSETTALEMVLHRELFLQGLKEGTSHLCDAFGALSQAQFDSVRVAPVRAKASVAMTMAADGWGS